MTVIQQITFQDSPVKRALDHAEHVERVPILQRAATQYERHLNDRGSYILIFPRHPAVIAYARELKRFAWPDVNLKDARRLYRDACEVFDNRVLYRRIPDVEWADQSEGEQFVSLSAILEARAAATHWRRVVNNKAMDARVARQTERQTKARITRWQAARELSAAFKRVNGVPHGEPR
jgi:hypothetical protein